MNPSVDELKQDVSAQKDVEQNANKNCKKDIKDDNIKVIGVGLHGTVFGFGPSRVAKAFTTQSACTEAQHEFAINDKIDAAFGSSIPTSKNKDAELVLSAVRKYVKPPAVIAKCDMSSKQQQKEEYTIKEKPFFCYYIMSRLDSFPLIKYKMNEIPDLTRTTAKKAYNKLLKNDPKSSEVKDKTARIQKRKLNENGKLMLKDKSHWFNKKTYDYAMCQLQLFGKSEGLVLQTGREYQPPNYYVTENMLSEQLLKDVGLSLAQIKQIEGFIYGWIYYKVHYEPHDIEITLGQNTETKAFSIGVFDFDKCKQIDSNELKKDYIPPKNEYFFSSKDKDVMTGFNLAKQLTTSSKTNAMAGSFTNNYYVYDGLDSVDYEDYTGSAGYSAYTGHNNIEYRHNNIDNGLVSLSTILVFVAVILSYFIWMVFCYCCGVSVGIAGKFISDKANDKTDDEHHQNQV